MEVAGGGAVSQGWGFEGTASNVQGVAEIVAGDFRSEIGPEQLHNLLAVEAVPLSQGEYLEQALGLPQVPHLVPDASRPHRNPEATEQPDAKRLQRSASLWDGRGPLIELGLCFHSLVPRL